MTQEAGEENTEVGMTTGEDTADASSAGADMIVGNAQPSKEEGCHQSSTNSDRTAHLIGILLFGLLVIRRRRCAA